jgi:GNAT superfamily N-acetyltransferase
LNSDTLKGASAHIASHAHRSTPFTFAPVLSTESAALARIYLEAYPPGIGAVDLEDAQVEITKTFDGGYGVLLGACCVGAYAEGQLVGAVLTVEKSPWDPDLHCPFIIELFVDPSFRGGGAGRELILRCAEAALRGGHAELALRVGEGTSPGAFSIYQSLGMKALR